MSTTDQSPRVDFGYAFGTPHRLTVAPPDSGDKTLVDCEPGKVTLSWSYDNLLSFSIANFHGPLTQWTLDFQAVIDGQKVGQSTWRRLDDCLPGLAAEFTHQSVRTTMEVIGGRRAAIARVEFTNLDPQAAHRAAVECSVPGNWRGVMPAFVDPGLAGNARDALVAGWMARADRVIIAAIGGEEYPLSANTLAPTVTLLVCARVVPAVILTTYIPLTPGGLGQREVVFRYMFGLVGVAPDAAVATSLLFFAMLMALAAMGGLCLLAERALGLDTGDKT